MNTPAQIISRAREARAKLKDGHIRLSQALTELNDISAKDIAEQTDQLGDNKKSSRISQVKCSDDRPCIPQVLTSMSNT